MRYHALGVNLCGAELLRKNKKKKVFGCGLRGGGVEILPRVGWLVICCTLREALGSNWPMAIDDLNLATFD